MRLPLIDVPGNVKYYFTVFDTGNGRFSLGCGINAENAEVDLKYDQQEIRDKIHPLLNKRGFELTPDAKYLSISIHKSLSTVVGNYSYYNVYDYHRNINFCRLRIFSTDNNFLNIMLEHSFDTYQELQQFVEILNG